ncbi:hypothetical protein [Natrialba asiatica]|uniref:Domain of unknown function domain-containing protein n=1 Tax=Natrialba asiatica (strain ATCC 700177 / DSM 12278 / JCM 9576 / FERM P-10747 / NBRC 102637 / 172P1) TaxID=29540 RepID=M0ALQ2_NATA1|nr:hypothetical protein [Natrialba asiatica]ELY99459.1 hypothetical protein C481_14538 [Natrialba asiatica DSM 12278]
MTPGLTEDFDLDRDRGILTPADRDFLRGEKEYSSEQSERDARYRIRQRLMDSILDFNILVNNMDEKDREQIFESNFSKSEKPPNDEITEDDLQELVKKTMFINGISSAIGFFYLGVTDTGSPFDEVLESGIEIGEEQRGYVVEDVNVSYDVSRKKTDIKKLVQKLETGDPLEPDELRAIVRSGDSDLNPELLDNLFSRLTDDISSEMEKGEIDLHLNSDEE